MEFHKTCKTLPIYSFNEIIKNGDLKYLIKNFDEYTEEEDEFKFGVEDVIEARGIFKEIMYEYSALTGNRNLLLSYQAQIKIAEEEFRYMIAEKILSNFAEFEDVEVLMVLNGVNIPFYLELDIEAQVVSAIRYLKRLKTRISVMKINYDQKFKKNAKQKLSGEVIDNLDQEAIELELALKISYSIDTKKTSVSKWINMWNVANRINKPKTK
jgi:hypothetical protein